MYANKIYPLFEKEIYKKRYKNYPECVTWYAYKKILQITQRNIIFNQTLLTNTDRAYYFRSIKNLK